MSNLDQTKHLASETVKARGILAVLEHLGDVHTPPIQEFISENGCLRLEAYARSFEAWLEASKHEKEGAPTEPVSPPRWLIDWNPTAMYEIKRPVYSKVVSGTRLIRVRFKGYDPRGDWWYTEDELVLNGTFTETTVKAFVASLAERSPEQVRHVTLDINTTVSIHTLFSSVQSWYFYFYVHILARC